MSHGKRGAGCDPGPLAVYLDAMPEAKHSVSKSEQITIRVFGALRDLAGTGPLCVTADEATDVDGLLAWLDRRRPKLGSALQSGLRDGYLNILINGRNVRFLDGHRTRLAAGDTVAFLPPIGGG